MILVKDIRLITEYCQSNRPDQDSEKPYFIAIENEGWYKIPEDRLIKKGLYYLKMPYWIVSSINGISIEIEIEPEDPTNEP